MKAQLRIYGYWEDITILTVQTVPELELVAEDFKYSFKEKKRYSIIYIDQDGDIYQHYFYDIDDLKIKK